MKKCWTYEVIITKAPAARMMAKAVSLHSPRTFEQFLFDERIDRAVSPRLSTAVRSSRSTQKIHARNSILRYRQIMFHTSAQRMSRLRKASRIVSKMREE